MANTVFYRSNELFRYISLNTRKVDILVLSKSCKRQLHRNCNVHFKDSQINKCILIPKLLERRPLGGIVSYRFASTGDNSSIEEILGITETVKNENLSSGTSVPEPLLDKIPDPPPIPQIQDIADTVQLAATEPPFESLGLGGWSPVGIVENCFQYLHVSCGLPWWATIIAGTFVVKALVFPIFIIAQRNAAKMNNHLPQMQVIQVKLTEARQTGNHLEVAKLSHELVTFMQEKGINPIKNMIVPLAQAPLFISFFMSLREMANVPVESMRHGGLLWFSDLTLCDQLYLLPLFTSLTLWATIELGAEGAKLNQTSHVVKYVLRGIPIVIFPFTLNFPAAVLCYWFTSNVISLGQVALLKIPKAKKFFKIDPLISIRSNDLPIKPKPFIAGFKESWNNMKISKQMEDRSRFSHADFTRAGRAPIQKTYSYDPTKPRPDISNLQAKKRDT